VADVDLIPAEYVKLQLTRRLTRRLLIASVSVALIVGAMFLTLKLAASFERSNIARLDKEKQVSSRTKAEADGYRQRKLLAEKQLAELDELLGGDRLRLLLQAIDAAHNDSVWLDELRLLRRDPAAAVAIASPTGAAASALIVPPAQAVPGPGVAAAPPAGREQRVELIGHATNHTRVAEFMRALSSQPGIAEVRLLDTGLGSYNNTPVIDLTLLLLVDGNKGKPR